MEVIPEVKQQREEKQRVKKIIQKLSMRVPGII
ncbi:unknown [Clostridium sp. CAG:253]|nr:unknown [Clostridium sp. CAG:253]